MILFTKCRSCKNEIAIKSYATDRIDLAKDMGETFPIQCLGCLTTEKYHINDVRAKGTKIIKLIAFAITVLGTLAVGYFLGSYLLRLEKPNVGLYFIFTFPSFLGFYLLKYDRDNVRRFNEYRG